MTTTKEKTELREAKEREALESQLAYLNNTYERPLVRFVKRLFGG